MKNILLTIKNNWVLFFTYLFFPVVIAWVFIEPSTYFLGDFIPAILDFLYIVFYFL
jgi:sorbitol-specific phosphotransferase system component IIC